MASSFVVEFGCLGKMEYPMLCPFPLAPFRGKNKVGGVDSDGPVWTLRVAATAECLPTFLELAVNVVITDGCGCQVHIYIFDCLPFRYKPCSTYSSKGARLTVGLKTKQRKGAFVFALASACAGTAPKFNFGEC